ncbi:hypothetical protein L2E82_12635 [Cichorium intybus]|uniref:Uncharacterized protein n=1 Tax=Cichorium intybus TaxID=13427 RepID=A0ACB9GGM2_CICIN|nr:hypothetical protein L2E82_12635 [Cichorium intybus]
MSESTINYVEDLSTSSAGKTSGGGRRDTESGGPKFIKLHMASEISRPALITCMQSLNWVAWTILQRRSFSWAIGLLQVLHEDLLILHIQPSMASEESPYLGCDGRRPEAREAEAVVVIDG